MKKVSRELPKMEAGVAKPEMTVAWIWATAIATIAS